ncbi:sigma factor-like helix-turn-helix DNA-binding protein [Streptomyces sp. enrichment culture]|uniref:sigma factor-like helix-turn-helix DNA-binding protein n=1 Tax=Streptomyces sp. enrichment culture TaxID=1795815 RepID=UPI003F57D820
MSRAEAFRESRPVLFCLAHRILGVADEADKAVHEAWLQYEAAPVVRPEFLPAAVTRIALSMRHPAGDGPRCVDPAECRDLAEPLTTAALVLLERLSPLGRAVFVLNEVLGCGPAEIASAVGCSEAAAGRLVEAVSRASDGGGQAPPWPQRIVGAEQVARVLAAIVPPLVRIGVTMDTRPVNGRPGAVFRDRTGRALTALSLEIVDGLIGTIRWTRM